MAELTDLYQEVILDHNRHPRNYGAPLSADAQADGYNPLCGDRVTVYVTLAGEVVRDVRFEGSGCAISKASASLMTEAIIGRSTEDALALFHGFQAMVTAPDGVEVDHEALGKLEVLAGVREFPMRVKCATLAWHTLKAALIRSGATVRTE